MWRDVLRECTLPECLLVLDAWITGKRPGPKAYERSQVALMLRQSVFFDRDKDAQRTRTDNAADEYRKTRRNEYRPLAITCPACV